MQNMKVATECECGLNLYAIMTNGREFEYIVLGAGCGDRIARAEDRGWYRANRCEVCGTIYPNTH